MSDVIDLLESFKQNSNGKEGTYNNHSLSMSDFNIKEDLIQFIKDYSARFTTYNYIGLVSFTDTREHKTKCSVHLLNDLIDIRDMGYKYTIGRYDKAYEATAIIHTKTIAGLLDKTPCTQSSIGVIDIHKIKFFIQRNPDFKEIIKLV